MLPRPNRLRTRRDFGAASRPRQAISGPHLVVKVSPGAQPHPRFGIVVSKKTAARAHDRNLIKRRIRAAASSFIKQPTSIDILIIARPGCRAASGRELIQETTALIDQAIHAQTRH